MTKMGSSVDTEMTKMGSSVDTEMTILGISENRKFRKQEIPEMASYSNKEDLVIKNYTNKEGEGEKNQNAHPPAQNFKSDFSANGQNLQPEPNGHGQERKKVAPKKESYSQQETEFDFSPEAFAQMLPEIPNLNTEHYYQKIKLNAQAKGLKMKNWQAYIQKWILEDKEQGKLKLIVVNPHSSSKEQDQTETIQAEINRLQKFTDIRYRPQEAESLKDKLRELWRKANDTQRKEIEHLVENIQIQDLEEDNIPSPDPNFIQHFKINKHYEKH